MRGFKAFNKDLTCRGFQYEIGQTYEMKEEPMLCNRGFHFCKTIAKCYNYYSMDGIALMVQKYISLECSLIKI